MKVTIKKIGINGEGIGYYQRKPVFIPGAFIGEIADCSLTDKGRYYLGTLNRIIARSKDRISSGCPYHSDCGSCVFMDLDYEKQLEYKKEILKESLKKYADIDMDIDIETSSKTCAYRNKCSMPIAEDRDGRLCSVMYRAGSNHPVFIERCLMHDDTLEEIRIRVMEILNRHDIEAYDRKSRTGLRHIVIRGFDDEYQLVLITGKDRLDKALIDDLSRIDKLVSIYQDINTVKDLIPSMFNDPKLLYGKKKISLKLDGYDVLLSPASFFQLNHDQAISIYRDVKNHVSDCSLLVEAYSGIGTISLYLADKAEKVISIELNKDAVNDGKDNMKLNSVDNVEFIAGDTAEVIRELTRDSRINTLVVDPPRVGLDEKLIESIIRNRVENIIYVSCNPTTLAKNLAVLLRHYDLGYIRAYDMFPNTAHVETLCCLYRKKKR